MEALWRLYPGKLYVRSTIRAGIDLSTTDGCKLSQYILFLFLFTHCSEQFAPAAPANHFAASVRFLRLASKRRENMTSRGAC